MTPEEMRAELQRINREIADDTNQRVLREVGYRNARRLRRLNLEREIAASAGQQHAEPLALPLVVGDEWHLLSNTRDTVLICGDAGKETSSCFVFKGVAEVVLRGLNDDSPANELVGSGLDTYGLFLVRDSVWKRRFLSRQPGFGEFATEALEHYILCGREGELSCLAQTYDARELRASIVEVREQATTWSRLAAEASC